MSARDGQTTAGIGALCLLLALAGASCSSARNLVEDPIDASSPLAGLETGERSPVSGLREPSDLAFDPKTGTLWTVSDTTGQVFRLALDGSIIGSPIETGARDLEGIAIDPVTGHLLVLDEARGEVIELTQSGEPVRRFTVPGGKGDNGYEGIAVDPAGEEIVLVHEREPAELVFLSRTGEVKRRARVRTQDLSAVTFAPGGETLVLVGRFEEALLEVDRKGTILNRLPFNLSGVEGVAIRPDGRILLVADHGLSNPGDLITLEEGGLL